MRFREWLTIFVVSVVGGAMLFILDTHDVANPPADPFYVNPSQYERTHGTPDIVCKWWGGDGYATPAEHKECVVKLGEQE